MRSRSGTTSTRAAPQPTAPAPTPASPRRWQASACRPVRLLTSDAARAVTHCGSPGWRVTAVDISAVAVERLTALARAHALDDRVLAARHDLQESFPPGDFDLVCAHYLHTPFGLDRSTVLRSAAHALRPGGRLLVVDHGSTAPWSWNQDPGHRYPSPREVADGIDLNPDTWTVERAEAPRRIATGPDGSTAEVTDHVLLFRRTA